MEKELKDYLDRISTDISGIKESIGTLATKEELAEVRESMATKAELTEIRKTMATKAELTAVKNELGAKIDKLDRRLTKKINDTLEYVKLVDEDVAAHRRNTEVHVPGSRKA